MHDLSELILIILQSIVSVCNSMNMVSFRCGFYNNIANISAMLSAQLWTWFPGVASNLDPFTVISMQNLNYLFEYCSLT